jgi:hypothetical protein
MPPAGPRAPGWTGPHPALPPYSGWGQGGGHPVPAGQAKAEQTGPGPSSQNRLTGQTRPAPLRVADGDGMDRQVTRRGRAAQAREFLVTMRRKRTAEMDPDKPWKRQGNRPDKAPGIPVNDRAISYNLNDGERPAGLRIRYKIRVESGKKAAARDAMLAAAVKELLEWSRQHRTHP